MKPRELRRANTGFTDSQRAVTGLLKILGACRRQTGIGTSSHQLTVAQTEYTGTNKSGA